MRRATPYQTNHAVQAACRNQVPYAPFSPEEVEDWTFKTLDLLPRLNRDEAPGWEPCEGVYVKDAEDLEMLKSMARSRLEEADRLEDCTVGVSVSTVVIVHGCLVVRFFRKAVG